MKLGHAKVVDLWGRIQMSTLFFKALYYIEFVLYLKKGPYDLLMVMVFVY